MIKGRYVVTLDIDMRISDDARETDTALLPIDKLRYVMRNDLTPDLVELIQHELNRYVRVFVYASQKFADVYEVLDEEE